MLPWFVISFLSRSKHLLILWLYEEEMSEISETLSEYILIFQLIFSNILFKEKFGTELLNL